MASGLPPCAFECGSLDQHPWLSVAQPRSSLRFNTEAASERLHHRRERRADWPVWSIGHRRPESSQHSPAMGKAETFPGDTVTRPAGIRAEWGLGPHHRFDLQLWVMSRNSASRIAPVNITTAERSATKMWVDPKLETPRRGGSSREPHRRGTRFNECPMNPRVLSVWRRSVTHIGVAGDQPEVRDGRTARNRNA